MRGIYQKSQDFTKVFARVIVAKKPEQNISKSAVMKDRNCMVD